MDRLRRSNSTSGIMLLAGTTGLIVAVAIYTIHSLQNSNVTSNQARFSQISKGYTETYKQTLNSYIQHLRTTRSLFYATDNVLPEEFAIFARQIIEVYPEIQAIEWVPKTTAGQRGGFELRMQNSGYPNFALTEFDERSQIIRAREREIYFPILYIEPLKPNIDLLGHDLASRSDIYDTLKKARDTGQPFASTQLAFANASKPEDSLILIILPVYQSRDTPADLQDRENDLHGFILGNFFIGESFKATIEQLDLVNISIVIRDVTDAQNPVELFRHNALPRIKQSRIFQNVRQISDVQHVYFSGQKWQLLFQTQDIKLDNRQENQIWLTIIIATLLIAGLTGFTLYKRSR